LDETFFKPEIVIPKILRPALPPTIQSHLDEFYSSPNKIDCEGKCLYRGGSPRKIECELLARLVLDVTPVRTIDWGLGDAAACIAIVLARKELCTHGKHVSLDPFQHSISKDVGLIQLQSRGLREGVDFREDRSEDFLVEAARSNRAFDFIFVDGDHSLGGKVTDAYLADRVLRPGGIIAFHDSLFKSTSAAISFLMRSRSYELVDLGVEKSWKIALRSLRHASRLGAHYAFSIIPRLGVSIAALRKPIGSLDAPHPEKLVGEFCCRDNAHQ
jgi:hypothetical protein